MIFSLSAFYHGLAIALGGALGALLRYQLSTAVYSLTGRNFPYGTLTVNLLGSLLIGVLFVYLQNQTQRSEFWQLFLMVGFLGSLTTFSTFSLDTLTLLQQGLWLKTGMNIGLNVGLCILATALGIRIGQSFS